MSGDAETRLYLLLQGVGWMGQFANYMSQGGEMRPLDLSKLERADESPSASEAVAAILGQLDTDVDEAARTAFGYAKDQPDIEEFFRSSLSILFRKVDESHRFKYAAAIFEDLALVSPAWRPHMLAASTYYLHGPSDRDSAPVTRAREELGIS